MRWLLLLALAVSGLAFASSPRTLPRGDGKFWLGMTRAQLDSAVTARGLEVLTSSLDHITCASDAPEVEYEDYAFMPAPAGPSRLWKATVAYRVPYSGAAFDSVRARLLEALGGPDEQRGSRDPGASQTLVWVDAATTVRLGARWTKLQDPRTDRMLVVWTDRKLQRLIENLRREERTRR